MKLSICRIAFLIGLFLASGGTLGIAITGFGIMGVAGLIGGAFEKRKKPRVGRR